MPGQTERELRSSAVDAFSEDGYLKWKGTSRFDWAWKGIDVAVTANYRDGFHEILALDPSFPDGKNEHWIKQTWFFDLQASYDFRFGAETESGLAADSSKAIANVTTAAGDLATLETSF